MVEKKKTASRPMGKTGLQYSWLKNAVLLTSSVVVVHIAYNYYNQYTPYILHLLYRTMGFNKHRFK